MDEPGGTAAAAGGGTTRLTRRERAVDVALAAATSAVVAAGVLAAVPESGDNRPADWLAYAAAVGVGAPLLARRHHPGLVLVVSALVLTAYHSADYSPVGLAVPLAAALYSLAEAGGLRRAAAAVVVLAAGSAVARASEGEDLALLLGFALVADLALMVAAVALGDAVRARRLVQVEARARAERERAEAVLAAARLVEEERLRIARDLHDVLAHTVSVISLHADVAAEALADHDAAAASASLGHIRAASGEAMSELRQTLHLLRDDDAAPDREPPRGLADVPRLAAATSTSGLPVRVTTTGDPAPLDLAVDTTGYRVVQEALTNALRHARATRVNVAVHHSPGGVAVEVTDDGAGLDAAGVTGAGAAGRGLLGMRERAALVGGSISAGPLPGGGYRVAVRLPAAQAPAAPAVRG